MDEPYKLRNLVRILLGTLLVALVLARCGPIVVSEPFSGLIVDAVTGKPIEGAIVVAHWDLRSFESSSLDSFVVEEAVTDGDGLFSIPGWGPKFNGRFLFASIRSDDPEVILFKNNYHPRFERDYGSSGWFYLSADAMDGTTFYLTPFEDSTEAYLEACLDVESRIRWQIGGRDCSWKKIPHLLAELHAVGSSAIEQGIEGRQFLIERIPERRCGNPKDFLKGYIQ